MYVCVRACVCLCFSVRVFVCGRVFLCVCACLRVRACVYMLACMRAVFSFLSQELVLFWASDSS